MAQSRFSHSCSHLIDRWLFIICIPRCFRRACQHCIWLTASCSRDSFPLYPSAFILWSIFSSAETHRQVLLLPIIFLVNHRSPRSRSRSRWLYGGYLWCDDKLRVSATLVSGRSVSDGCCRYRIRQQIYARCTFISYSQCVEQYGYRFRPSARQLIQH